MKKNKSEDRTSADFQNKPFKSLKGFASKSAPAIPQKSSTQQKNQKARPEDDDPSLFLRAMAGAARLDNDEETVEEQPAAQRDNARVVKPAADDEQLFLKAMQGFGTSMRNLPQEEEQTDEPRRSASSRMKQLRRGTIRISGELDLHGYLRDEALAQLKRFITGAYGEGREAVLVITGKGTNSADGPVLPGAVASWLQANGKGMVAEFHPAPGNLGGSGALVVFLKRK